MKKLLRILGLIVLIPVGLLFLLIVVMSIISPPRGGKKTAAALQVPYPAVVAHRGLSGLAPEATLPAYLLARECGADYLEADLQRTADGVIIVFHDDTPARTTNAARVFPGRENDPIGSFTYAELTELDAGSWFNEAFPELARAAYAGLKILTLDELIDIAEGGNNNPGLYLETKAPSSYPGIEAQIVEILRARGWIGGPAPKPAPPDPSLNAAVIRKEPPQIRGKLTGIFTGGIDAGAFLGAVALGYVGEWAGFRFLFLAAGLALIAGLAALRWTAAGLTGPETSG